MGMAFMFVFLVLHAFVTPMFICTHIMTIMAAGFFLHPTHLSQHLTQNPNRLIIVRM
ncbi:hypothetical protein GQS_00735 [Thermococcus sp. 4557]|nr:hypothetical protein GQS_00735 [Thermococcus sp. 4557]